MITLYNFIKYIYEAKASRYDFEKHEPWVKNFIKRLLNPEINTIAISVNGGEYLNIDDENRPIFELQLRKLLNIPNDTPLTDDVIDKIDIKSLELDYIKFDNILKYGNPDGEEGKKDPHSIIKNCPNLGHVWTHLYNGDIKGKNDLNATDLEFITAYALNEECTSQKYKDMNDEDKMCIILGYKNPSKDQRAKVKRYLNYYKENSDSIKKSVDKIRDQYIKNVGEFSYPLVKVNKDKKRNDNIDNSPKTDLCMVDDNGKFVDGSGLSLKKYGGSQLTSGGIKETISMFEKAMEGIKDEELIKEYNELKARWEQIKGYDEGANKELLSHITKLLSNDTIRYRISKYSTTGEHKFEKGSISVPSMVLTFDLFNDKNCEIYTCKEYVDYISDSIENGINKINKKEVDKISMISVNKKSSNKSIWNVFRIITSKNILNEIRDLQLLNMTDDYSSKETKTEETEDEIINPETGKREKVTIQKQIGPRGGKRYRVKREGKDWTQWDYRKPEK